MSAYTDKVRPLVYRPLKKAHVYAYVLKNIFLKIEQCHKLLLVLGGDLTLTRSYSERWQVARIRLCGRGAVCCPLKFQNYPISGARR